MNNDITHWVVCLEESGDDMLIHFALEYDHYPEMSEIEADVNELKVEHNDLLQRSPGKVTLKIIPDCEEARSLVSLLTDEAEK